MKLILESRKVGETNWGIRSRLDDLNSLIHERKLSIDVIMERAELIRTRWIGAEPDSEFRVIAAND